MITSQQPVGQLVAEQQQVAVSVLIPFLNEDRYLPNCVPAMQDQKFDGEIEFLFIDGQSEDGAA